MKILILFCSITFFMMGCNSIPFPKQLKGNWAPVNQQISVKVTNPKAAESSIKKDVRDNAQTPVQHKSDMVYSLSLEQAIKQYIPPSYKLEIDPDVNLTFMIDIVNSKNWLEALGQGMSEANIEFVTNLHKKSATIKRTKLSLAEAIDLLLPNDYTVFTDTGINQNTLLHFDTRKYWVDALSKGMAETGIELTINFTGKIIYLTSARRDIGQSTAITN